MIEVKGDLYIAMRNSTVVDYCIFNKEKNDNEKNEFLSLLLESVTQKKWFNLTQFNNLGSRPTNKEHTQVPIADSQDKEEEFNSLSKAFNKDELINLVSIIKNLKSYAVLPIKELTDTHDEANKPGKLKSFFLKIFP